MKEAAGKVERQALLMPLIILGGIFSGIVTPTEAAAVAAVYGFVVVIVIYRDFSIRHLPRRQAPATATATASGNACEISECGWITWR